MIQSAHATRLRPIDGLICMENNEEPPKKAYLPGPANWHLMGEDEKLKWIEDFLDAVGFVDKTKESDPPQS